MLENGYVSLHRSMLSWEWYDDIYTFKLFVHLLLTVNFEDKKWHGIVIHRGERVASYSVLCSETKMSERQLRTAIKKLKTTGELTLTTSPKFGLYTINNFNKFQEATLKSTPKRHSSDTQATPKRQQDNKDNKDNKEIKKQINKETDKERSADSAVCPPACGGGHGGEKEYPESYYIHAKEKGITVEQYNAWRNQ